MNFSELLILYGTLFVVISLIGFFALANKLYAIKLELVYIKEKLDNKK